MEEEGLFNSATLKDGFAGNRKYLKGFLAKINLVFMLYPDRYQEEESKVIYLISRLYGNAMNWAATLIENEDPCLYNYQSFVEKLKAFYGYNDAIFVANQNLRTIKQHNLGGIRGYILEFNKYAGESNWNEEAKIDAFIAGLHNQIAVKILEMFPGPRNLSALQTIASRIDSRIHSNQLFTQNNSRKSFPRNLNNNSKRNSGSSQKYIPRGPLSKEEKERRRKENLCLYCGSSTHSLNDCPKRNKRDSGIKNSALMSIPNNTNNSHNEIHPEKLASEFKIYFEYDTDVLIDSGSFLNLIDRDYCKKYGIPYNNGPDLPKITGIGGKQAIYGITAPLCVKYKNHLCKAEFYITDLPFYSCILGLEWLKLHNPSIDFQNDIITFNSDYCRKHCLLNQIDVSDENNFPAFSTLSESVSISMPVFIDNPKSSNGNSYSTNNILNPCTNESNYKTFERNCSNSSLLKRSSSTLFSFVNDFYVNKASTSNCSVSNSESATITTLPNELFEFSDVFNEKEAEKLPPHREYDCQINLVDNAKLFYGPNYSLTDEETTVLEKYLYENQKKGFIRKSCSPAGAPILFVPKKNGELRLCQDYRELNKITIRDSYPLPSIQDIFEHLGKAKIFSKLDLRSAYNLVRIKEGDEYKTAFTCKFGHFEYLVMPFGLKNAPAVFQHFINDVLEDCIGKFAYAYIDDIIIFSSNFATHLIHVKTVLLCLRKAGLFTKLEKCEFFASFIDFLGHRISSKGIHMDPKKVSSIVDWPTPTNVKEVQSFIGLANYYRRFIPGFADLAHPLHRLLKKNVKFVWSLEAQNAFDTLKSKSTSYPVLIHPNRDLPFIVETDSSNFAIGAVLSQKSPEDKSVHHVAFFSRSLSSTEKNYPIYDKELLAIVSALETWRHFLKGTSTPFTIYSDHRNLLFQKKPQKMTQRLIRWSLFLSEFNFKILYRSGSSNGKPDALSRRPDYADPDDSSLDLPFSVLRPENFCALVCSVSSLNDDILNGYKDDPFYSDVCNYLNFKKPPIPHNQIDKFSLSNSFLLFNSRIYVPPSCRFSIFKICHDSPTAGHFGFRKTNSLFPVTSGGLLFLLI